MSINYSVSFSHFIRILYKYENPQNFPGVKVYQHFELVLAQESVRELLSAGTPIMLIDFYTSAHIIPSNSRSMYKSKDLGQVSFTPEQFLEVTNSDLGEAIAKGMAELDKFMADQGATRLQ